MNTIGDKLRKRAESHIRSGNREDALLLLVAADEIERQQNEGPRLGLFAAADWHDEQANLIQIALNNSPYKFSEQIAEIRAHRDAAKAIKKLKIMPVASTTGDA